MLAERWAHIFSPYYIREIPFFKFKFKFKKKEKEKKKSVDFLREEMEHLVTKKENREIFLHFRIKHIIRNVCVCVCCDV